MQSSFTPPCIIPALAALALVISACPPLVSQDNYEIQVYPSETQAPRTLLVELHSNYTVEGSTTTQFDMLPTQGQEHETVEFTEGINNWAEVASTFSPRNTMAPACSGWATIFVLVCGSRRVGTGRLASACPTRSVTRARLMRIQPGSGRSCPSPIKPLANGTGQSTQQ